MVEPVIFADIGGGNLKKINSGEEHGKMLAGAGGGIKVHCTNNFYLRLDWAKALADKPASGSGPSTFYFTLSSEI